MSADAAYICEDEEMELTCPDDQVIKVYDAFYGRDTKAYCNDDDADLPTDCSASSEDIAMKLGAICDGRSKCTLRVNNAYLGDPCSGQSKYLSVNYVCGGKHCKTTYHFAGLSFVNLFSGNCASLYIFILKLYVLCVCAGLNEILNHHLNTLTTAIMLQWSFCYSEFGY